jgi:hypothetical protein
MIPRSVSTVATDSEIEEQVDLMVGLFALSVVQLRIVPATLDLEWPRGHDHRGSSRSAASTVWVKRIQVACSDRSSPASPTGFH